MSLVQSGAAFSRVDRDRCRHRTVWLVIMLSSHEVILVKTDISLCSHTPLHLSGFTLDVLMLLTHLMCTKHGCFQPCDGCRQMKTPSELCGDICFYTCTSVSRRQAESENTHICTVCALHCMHFCWKASLQPERLKECLKCVCDGVGGALFDLSLGKQEPGLV